VHVRRARAVVGAVVATAAVGTAVGIGGVAGATPLAASSAMATCTAKIGFMGPFTGDAAPIGQEQLKWGQFGLQQWNAAHGTNIQIVKGDTQLKAPQATTVARKLQSDSSVVGVVGPAGSQEVAAVGAIYTRAGMAYVSPSATDPSLSKNKTFFRVVPTDDVQGPNDADYLTKTLGVKSVYIIDDQSSYSTGLAKTFGDEAKKNGATVKTDSVTQAAGQDYSSLANKIDTAAVFLPWQIAANAQQFAQALQAAGKGNVKLFGSDGLFSPGTFTANGAFVSSFAPDIRGIAADKAVVAAYDKKYGKKWGTFGPPTYVAMQVVAAAVTKACAAGGGKASRSAVLANVAKTNMPKSLIGPIKFDSSKHNLVGARFFIFKINGQGDYNLVH
jgi:branched-chain amino acid transport system substrate-binding protein